MAAKQRCPKCNTLNDLNSSACASCGAPLVQVCPTCGTVRPWYVARCSRCEGEGQDAAEFTRLFQGNTSGLIHDRYVVRETLCSSGISTAFRTVDAAHPTESYIVKAYSTVALFRARERRERLVSLESALRQWRACEHPALPRIIETFESGNKYYVVSPYVDGLCLDQMIEHPQMRITPAIARNWGAQLCDLVAYLHSRSPALQVPHLRPSHIMVSSEGQLLLVGLGLGRFFSGEGATIYGSTRGYAAPELADTGPTVASDIFCIGRILYAMLVDRLLEKGMRKALPLRQAVPGIDNNLVKAVARAAHRSPEQRFASARELGRALWPADERPQPLSDWLQTVAARVTQTQIDGPRSTTQSVRQQPPPARKKNPMEAFGFQRDPRFAPEPAQIAPTASRQTPEQAAGGTPQLSLYPRSLNLGQLGTVASKRVALTIRNIGDAELAGRIVSQVPWLKAPSRLIRIPAGKAAKVLVTVRSESLQPGNTNEPQALLVDSNAGRRWVGATAHVPSGPNLAYEPAALDFGQFPQQMAPTSHLTISNSGSQVLSGSARSAVDWISLPKPDFRCSPGEAVSLQVTLLPDVMPRGAQALADAILLDSDGGQARVSVQAQSLAAHLDVGTRHMDLGDATPSSVVERFLYLGNKGDGPLEGSIRSLLPWLQVFPAAFQCAPGDMVQVTVAADCAGLANGPIEAPQAVRIHSNGGSCSLSLRLRITAPDIRVDRLGLDFGAVVQGETPSQTLYITNQGSAPAQITVASLVDWLTVEPAVLDCPPGSKTALTVTAQTSSFERGQALGPATALTLQYYNARIEIQASLIVIKPALTVSPETVDFGYASPSVAAVRQITIGNDGTGPLAWHALSAAQWVEISPAEGTLQAGEHIQAQLSAYALALEAGVERAESSLVVNSDGGRYKLPLRIALAEPLLATDTLALDLGASINWHEIESSFRIFNHGLGQLTGQVHSDRAWLALGRTSFQCPTGHSVEVGLSTDMSEFPADTTSDEARITIESNGGETTIDVSVRAELAPDILAPNHIPLSVNGKGAVGGRLVLKNGGLATGRVQLRASHPGLSLSRDVCDIKPGKSAKLSIEWQATEPPTDEADLAIVITWEDQKQRIPVQLPVQATASA